LHWLKEQANILDLSVHSVFAIPDRLNRRFQYYLQERLIKACILLRYDINSSYCHIFWTVGIPHLFNAYKSYDLVIRKMGQNIIPDDMGIAINLTIFFWMGQ
jgi:hypothetical protein